MHDTGGNTAVEHGRDWRAYVAFAVPVVFLLPFLAKPVHIDDPLFIWTAQHILAHPFDFYGFDVVWMQRPEPMYAANLNPPGLAYYLALTGLLFGWSEPVLHGAMAPIAGLAGLGIYRLAQSLTTHPLLATLFAVLTPGFLVSASTIMSDIPLLAAYVWTIVLWRRGLMNHNSPYSVAQVSLPTALAQQGAPSKGVRGVLQRGAHCHLYTAAACASAAMFTKYFGVTLIPLLVVYAIAHRVPWRTWIIPALIPVVALAAYELLTHLLYGVSHFATASAYSSGASAIGSLSAAGNRILITFLFLGGCFLPALLLAPLIWSRRTVIATVAAAIAIAAWWTTRERVAYFPIQSSAGIEWPFIIHATIFAVAGVHLAGLLTRDVLRKRDPDTMLLFFWGFGALVFTAFFNHMVSARTVLPFAPVAGLVLARALPANWRPQPVSAALGLALAAALALTVTAADHAYARAYKQLAQQTATYAATTPHPLYFARQWSYQYYLEQTGAKPADLMRHPRESALLLAIPDGFTWNMDAAALHAEPVHRIAVDIPAVSTLMGKSSGAGFYSHFWGPLPYAFGPAGTAAATIYRVPAESNVVSHAFTD